MLVSAAPQPRVRRLHIPDGNSSALSTTNVRLLAAVCADAHAEWHRSVRAVRYENFLNIDVPFSLQITDRQLSRRKNRPMINSNARS